jgi:signal transduction histidine kinase
VQLTLLYAIPFFATGALLASVPLFGARSTSPVGSAPEQPPETHVESHGSLTSTVIAVAVLTVLSLLVGWWVSGRFLRPLRAITATAREISATNLSRRLGLAERKDEYGELAETLDDLFGRLGAAFESQRRFVANASHELRTPLTAERALLQVALANPDADPEELRRACTEVLALGRRQERLIDALLTLASSEQGVERRLPFDLGALVSEAVDARREEAAAAGIRLNATVSAAPLVGDPHLVGSLIANLLDNAVRHNVRGGRVEVVAGGNTLSVGNDGPLVPADEVDRLFEPFRQLGPDRLSNTTTDRLSNPGAHGVFNRAADRVTGPGPDRVSNRAADRVSGPGPDRVSGQGPGGVSGPGPGPDRVSGSGPDHVSGSGPDRVSDSGAGRLGSADADRVSKMGGDHNISSRDGDRVGVAGGDRLGGAHRDRLGNTGGHGLGLAIVRAIADAHGAALTAVPRAAGGLDITVVFPPAAG